MVLALWAVALLAAEDFPILTPRPGPEPAIRSPARYGARPGKPFLYRIPCTGERPMRFTARGLPPGLTLDESSGIVRGTTPARGEYAITFTARNRQGQARKVWRLVAGDTLSLTPQMGWNSWYTRYTRVTDGVIRQAAEAMISSGMADHGYEYVAIDDCWARRADARNPRHRGEPRDGQGNILPNLDFPDMKALTAFLHGKGLKAGIYTSPGPLTCGQYTGSWQHEEQDARTFAEWGFDLLKYDLCSYRKTPGVSGVAGHQKPYRLMGSILARQPRDIVLNICQYGLADVWRWGAEVGGHSWRTTGDLGLEKDTGLPGFYSIALKNAQHAAFAGPGHWNDPDYILIGVTADAHAWDREPAPRRVALTAHEQYSYMSLWALMASPLFFGGDAARLDPFTLNVLCNHEVIAVNQDELGRQARIVRQSAEELILAKPLADGSVAVGLFNLTLAARPMRAPVADLGLAGAVKLRDVWRQREAGAAKGELLQEVAPHGVALMRLRRR